MGARRGGGARVGRRPPPPLENKKSFFGYIGGLFATFLHMGGLLAKFFSFLGAFSQCGGLFATFHFMVGAFFVLAPALPPLRKFFAGAHGCKEGSRACSPEIFLGDRNLVNSGHVLLRFCLKNDKNNDKL